MSIERRTVTVRVREWDDDFVVSVLDFVHELTALLGSIPPKSREDAVIEFDRRGDDYEYARGELTVHYERPETDEEFAERRRYDERRELAEVQAEYLRYQALRKKFEPVGGKS